MLEVWISHFTTWDQTPKTGIQHPCQFIYLIFQSTFLIFFDTNFVLVIQWEWSTPRQQQRVGSYRMRYTQDQGIENVHKIVTSILRPDKLRWWYGNLMVKTIAGPVEWNSFTIISAFYTMTWKNGFISPAQG